MIDMEKLERILKKGFRFLFTALWLACSVYLGVLAYNHIKIVFTDDAPIQNIYFLVVGLMFAMFSALLFAFPFLTTLKKFINE
jgi:TRAP-type C4-dicarboxylate transport system permease small subunit